MTSLDFELLCIDITLEEWHKTLSGIWFVNPLFRMQIGKERKRSHVNLLKERKQKLDAAAQGSEKSWSPSEIPVPLCYL